MGKHGRSVFHKPYGGYGCTHSQDDPIKTVKMLREGERSMPKWFPAEEAALDTASKEKGEKEEMANGDT